MDYKTVRAMLPIVYAFAYRRKVEFRDSRPSAQCSEWTTINPDTTEFRLGDDANPAEWRWTPGPNDDDFIDEHAELRAALAAERARADEAVKQAAEWKDAAAMQYQQVKADRDRLRAAIEQAPHSPNCPTGVFGSGGTPRCSCWKRAALGEAK